MTDRLTYSPILATTIEDAWLRLFTSGYVIFSDENPDLGLDPAFRPYVEEHYFNKPGVLLKDPYKEPPLDRLRARDVVLFDFTDLNTPTFQEHTSVAVTPKNYNQTTRDYTRTALAGDLLFTEFLEGVANLIPLFNLNRLNTRKGTIGVNLFRTFTDVVSKPHRDEAAYVALYVVDKVGSGATSELYYDGATSPFMRHTLTPGQGIIFIDKGFKHNATPIIAAENGTTHRDIIVCTFDHPKLSVGHNSIFNISHDTI